MIQTRHPVWILPFVSACFHPTYDHPACGPNGECPNGLMCSVQRICEALGEDSPNDSGSDSLQCPSSYNVALPGPSRYRLIANGHRAWEQSDACNQDLPGATHLVVIETPQELADVKTFVSNPGIGIAGGGLYLGGVQLNTATSPSDAWLSFDGTPLINGWGGSEPNDAGGGETNHEEQFVEMAQTALYFIDIGGNELHGALCECDGKPIVATVAAAIDGYH